MQNQAPNNGGNGNSFPQNPEILSDEQMRARAAEFAQQVYEQQLAAMRAQRDRQLAYNAYTHAYNAYAYAYSAAAAGIQNSQNPQSAGTENAAAETPENLAETPEGTEETETPEIENFPEESAEISEEEISDENGVSAESEEGSTEEFPENAENAETESGESGEETEISGEESAEENESAPAPAPKRGPAANANRALKVPRAPIETALVSLYYIASRLIVAVVIIFCICLLGFLAIVLFTENPRYNGLRTSILSLFEIRKDESAPADDASAEKSVGIGIPDPARKSADETAPAEKTPKNAGAVPDSAPENFDYFSDETVPAEKTPKTDDAETESTETEDEAEKTPDDKSAKKAPADDEANEDEDDFDDESKAPGVIIETADTETGSDDDFSEDDDENLSEDEDSEDEEDSEDSEDGESENGDIFGNEDEAVGRALLF